MSLSKGYLIKYQEINENISIFTEQIDKWTSEFENLKKEYMKLTSFHGIQGETADAIKDDINKFSLVAIEHLHPIFQRLKTTLETYRDNYLEIDGKFSVFSYDDFESIEDRLEKSRDELKLITTRIESNLSAVSHLVSIDIPSAHKILEMHGETKYNIEKLKNEVGACEKLDSSYDDISQELDVLISYLGSKDTNMLEANFNSIRMIANGYYPDVMKDKKRSEKFAEIASSTVEEVVEAGTEPKFFRGLGNVMNTLSIKRGIFGPEGPGQFIIPNPKHAKISNLFNTKAETLSRYTKNLGKVGKILAVGYFIVGTDKDMKEGLGFEQAVMKNGLSTAGSVVVSRIAGGIATGLIVATGITGIGAVALSVGFLVAGSYFGAKAGESVYYHLIQNNIKGWAEVNKHLYDGIHPVLYPPGELDYGY